MSPVELRDLIVASLDDRKGRSILALDVTKLTDVTDYMVLASGTSARHVRALVDSLRETARRCAVHVLGIEGESTGTWVLVDLGDVVVHVMQADTRAFYDLERLWSEAGAARDEASDAPERDGALA
ncbi:MAG: ribosome silencing factor [Gammaproteobacteria bacterium]|nr:ribosome silencing factor [Gammaproteobacteria bacterium]